MRLADFIRDHIEPILSEWETFARRIWPGEATDPATLRDHAESLLRATISDMASAQTEVERSDKSKGAGAVGTGSDRVDAASVSHGADRAGSGFDLAELVSEYRALRGSVLRLWRESTPVAHPADLDDLTRFNESIDQSLTASVRGYSVAAKQCEAQLVTEQAARAGAEAANRAKDTFLATLSHELRTPLNAIVMWLGILTRDRCGPDELREGLTVIGRNTQAQVRLIEDILDVSRIVSGKFRLDRRTCAVGPIVEAAVAAVRPDALLRGVALDVRLDPSDVQASCDPERVQRIVGNLVGNAVKFTPAGGGVIVSLAREGATARVEVRDTGRGIAADFLPYVFDRFRQADESTRRAAGGLGLGLSIVKHLVELHGGTVAAFSAGEGRGSTFTVCLPAHESADGAADDGPPDGELDGPPRSEPSPIRLNGLRVLVVDDEPDALRAVAKVLEAAGAVVTAALDVGAALDALATARPELLVSDIGMPGRDGYDLIREVPPPRARRQGAPGRRADGVRAKGRPAAGPAGGVPSPRRQADRGERPDGDRRRAGGPCRADGRGGDPGPNVPESEAALVVRHACSELWCGRPARTCGRDGRTTNRSSGARRTTSGGTGSDSPSARGPPPPARRGSRSPTPTGS